MELIWLRWQGSCKPSPSVTVCVVSHSTNVKSELCCNCQVLSVFGLSHKRIHQIPHQSFQSCKKPPKFGEEVMNLVNILAKWPVQGSRKPCFFKLCVVDILIASPSWCQTVSICYSSYFRKKAQAQFVVYFRYFTVLTCTVFLSGENY